VETYAPIPEETLHRAPHALAVAGRVVRVVVLLVVGALVLRFAFEGPPPDFRDFGVVRTPVGTAEVVCGGDAYFGCGDATSLVFPSCNLTAAWRVYFGMPDSRQPSAGPLDAAVRRLIGMRPPLGKTWNVTCFAGYPLGTKAAKLEPI
jgi:hypothetical protein